MKLTLYFFLCFFSLDLLASEYEYLDFYVDGCSMSYEGLPFGKDKNLWLHCCHFHDKEYYLGGNKFQKKAADKRLYQCIKKTGHPYIASVYYIGTKAGGSPYFPASYRWGYGLREIIDGNSEKVSYVDLDTDTITQGMDKINAFECVEELKIFSENIKLLEFACNYAPTDFKLGD